MNPLKCDWAAQSTEYLGSLLTPEGIKLLPSKVAAITQIARPTSTKHIRAFVEVGLAICVIIDEANKCTDMFG